MRKVTCRKILFLLMIILSTLILTACEKKTTYSKAELVAFLPSSNLSSLESVYNGIADISKGKNEYHIRYEAKVKLGADFSDLDIRIDDDNKTMEIIAPEVSIVDIIVDPSSFSFIPSNPQLEINEILDACLIDVQEAVEKDYRLLEQAQRNFVSFIEGLLRPLIKETEYSVSWRLRKIKVVEEVIQWPN